MNRSKDLKDLFRKSLKRKATEVTVYRASDYRKHGTYEKEIDFGNKIRIYFYEWSDINRVPRTFDDMVSLEDYLRACGIFLHLYQRDIINNCGTVYMTCYKGTKELNVRGSYGKLMESMKEHDRLSKEIEDSQKTGGPKDSMPNPFYMGSGSIQKPHMIEPEGRYEEEYSDFWYS